MRQYVCITGLITWRNGALIDPAMSRTRLDYVRLVYLHKPHYRWLLFADRADVQCKSFRVRALLAESESDITLVSWKVNGSLDSGWFGQIHYFLKQ